MIFNEIIDSLSSAVFRIICHQNPEILTEINGHTIFLCPRCAGLHAGFFLFMVCTLPFLKARTDLNGWFPKAFCISSLLLLLTEWLLAQLQITYSTDESRYITGLLAGCASCLLLMAYRNYLIYKAKPSTSRSFLFVLIFVTLFLGLGFTNLSNGEAINRLLLIMVLFNTAFILHTIGARTYYVLSKNHKTYSS
ncbi:MAG TPA: DUF2085 domain-containing protein [Draconibacterium sp.]|nr:DUF2085 domain-containing protein [Draconibacterium sp.]